MADRGKRRRRAGGGAFGAARRFTLTPIEPGLVAEAGTSMWIEPAWDGHRVLATRQGDDVRLAAADGRDWTPTFPAIARAIARLPVTSIALDGVVCVLDDRGAPAFELLRTRVAAGPVASAVLIAWDVLAVDDDELRGQPLVERRRRLAALLGQGASVVLPSQALDGDLARVLAAVGDLGMRGVVARALDAPYDGAWHAYAAAAPIDWARSLSPPPPLSNADKVLFPRDGLCKRDLVGYYRDVAPLVLPQLVDRPVVIQRWPDGIDEFDWYQHRMPPRAPDYLRAAWVDGVRRIVIENVDALAWMVNQAGLTFHGFGSRLATLTSPDWAMIDLDPGDRSTWWSELIEVAVGVRRALELLELPSVVKTSGQRGLHVLVPLATGHSFAQAEAFARGLAVMLARLMPDLATLESEKHKRGGRVLVDHKQFVAKTLVAPYSVRAVDGASVSTPIAWSEVTEALDPRAFNVRSVRARIDAVGDLAAPLLAGTARLEAALARLADRAGATKA